MELAENVMAIGGIVAVLMDLGLDLMIAAGLFLLLAVGALAGAFVLSRRTGGPAAPRGAS
jgi:hypothetical protein